MSDELIKKELKLLTENIMEVLDSTAASKGESFARAVGVHLECLQLIEAISGLVVMAQIVDEGRAEYLFEISQLTLASISGKACGGLQSGQLGEVMGLAKTLYDRRQQVSQKLRQGMSDD